jgi:putative membrane protein insertion efficiency factor
VTTAVTPRVPPAGLSTSAAPGPAARVLLALVVGYRRFVGPLLGPRCRFAPTCSAYALQALTDHGAARGVVLTVRRLGRCHPFHPGGHDPVPPGTTSPCEELTVSPHVSGGRSC